METQAQLIERMAQAAVRLRCQDFDWDEEQIQIWMYKDPMGMRDMEKMRRAAKVMYECINSFPKADQRIPIYEAYVEQYFAPLMGARGYSSVIRTYPQLTEQEAKAKVKELESEWKEQGTKGSSFYVSFRRMKVVD